MTTVRSPSAPPDSGSDGDRDKSIDIWTGTARLGSIPTAGMIGWKTEVIRNPGS